MSAQQWFVACTAPRMESSAVTALRFQGYQARHLVCRERKIRRNRPFEFFAPLFPSYIFVALDLEKDQWGPVVRTKGVERMLMIDGERPAPLPNDAAERWIGRADCTGLIDFTRPTFALGAAVRASTGPFEGHVGEFDGLDSCQRVAVLFNVMGRKCRVVLDETQIEAA